MGKFKKLILVISCTALMLNPRLSEASSIYEEDSLESNATEISEINSIDLSQIEVGNSHTEIGILPNGQLSQVTITKVNDLPDFSSNINSVYQQGKNAWHNRYNVVNGVYNINVVTAVFNAGFKVNIVNSQITKAYDPWHITAIASTSGNLVLDSRYQATYYLSHSLSAPIVGGPSFTGRVRAKMEGTTLATYAW